jgi:hypothetical protein
MCVCIYKDICNPDSFEGFFAYYFLCIMAKLEFGSFGSISILLHNPKDPKDPNSNFAMYHHFFGLKRLAN